MRYFVTQPRASTAAEFSQMFSRLAARRPERPANNRDLIFDCRREENLNASPEDASDRIAGLLTAGLRGRPGSRALDVGLAPGALTVRLTRVTGAAGEWSG
ncbi:hypothetical protein FRAHR75_1060016 [Frankia sp. Hr75.2]|nr:hypothetical protein FRAHR75_1060016 [Frankia sp. Hr75.2]